MRIFGHVTFPGRLRPSRSLHLGAAHASSFGASLNLSVMTDVRGDMTHPCRHSRGCPPWGLRGLVMFDDIAYFMRGYGVHTLGGPVGATYYDW